MKNYITLLVFFIGFSSLVFSQEKNDLNKLTSGKWKIETVKTQNQTMDVAQGDNWMVFYKSGVYQISLGKEEQVGTWKMKDDANLNFDYENSNVSDLTDNHLLFSVSGFTLELSKTNI